MELDHCDKSSDLVLYYDGCNEILDCNMKSAMLSWHATVVGMF